MKVAITGGTGFIGTRLVSLLREAGHEVKALVRDEERAATQIPGAELFEYDAFELEDLQEGLAGCDAVINLAGDNLFSGRWLKQKKLKIRDSRVVTTRTLVEAMKALDERPGVLLSGSAIGYYGPREPDDECVENEFDAENFAPRDFLAHVCSEWEHAAKEATRLGTRVVLLRTGVVLEKGGGALKAMEPPFKLFAGGPIGSGKQVISWIHREDACRMIVWALENAAVSGPMNLTAPNPVTNKEFAKALGRALHRPAFVPTPGPALRLLLGEVASILTTGQRVVPRVALDGGFEFLYPTVDAALQAIYAPKTEATPEPVSA